MTTLAAALAADALDLAAATARDEALRAGAAHAEWATTARAAAGRDPGAARAAAALARVWRARAVRLAYEGDAHARAADLARTAA